MAQVWDLAIFALLYNHRKFEAIMTEKDEIGLEYIGCTIYSLPTDVQTRIDDLQMIAEDIVAKV